MELINDLVGAYLIDQYESGQIKYNAATNTTGFTATQSQIMGAEQTYLNLTGTLGAGAALTLPTAAILQATLTPQQAVVGSTVVLRVINSSSIPKSKNFSHWLGTGKLQLCIQQILQSRNVWPGGMV